VASTGEPGVTQASRSLKKAAAGHIGVGGGINVAKRSWLLVVQAALVSGLAVLTLGATTARTYTLVAADVGHVLGASVTATNAAGSTVVLSNGLGPVAARPPEPRHKPSVAGTKKLGQRVYEAADTWGRSPVTFTNRWLRCSAKGDTCVRITGKRLRCAGGTCAMVDIGTQWDYTVTRKDLGYRLRVRVSASNGAGRATATSEPTRIVKR
jgi:hypothetical protein